MRQRGLPSVTLVTERFLPLAKSVARSRGIPDLPIVVLPRDVDTLPPEQLRQVATQAFREAVALVLSSPARRPEVS